MAAGSQQKLWDAAFELDLSRVKKLRAQGASINKSDKDGCDALYHAVSCLWQNNPATAQKQRELVEYLIGEGADIHKRVQTCLGLDGPHACSLFRQSGGASSPHRRRRRS